ncbi:unnamed protein product [marine sediment metagenome]|uniref:Uncharacterized protein n=1 Tax=marine sediment metagenome TaxID=412755 RepID=X1GIK2_9ZZZZ
MSSEKLIVQKEERIAWLTFNRPEIHNAMDRTQGPIGKVTFL